MAGRPKKQFERIDEINSRAAALYHDLDMLTPDMHKQRAGSGDRLGETWLAALDATGEAKRKIHGLRALLALRAGIGGLEDLESEDKEIEFDESCNPTEVDDVTESTLIWIDGDLLPLGRWAAMFNRPIDLIIERVKSGQDWETAVITKPEAPTALVDSTPEAVPTAQSDHE